MTNLVFERMEGKATFERKTEVVESKGLGHPDVIADSIAETFSRNLSQEYLRRFGGENLLHHNVDKLDVVGGEVQTRFGGGEVRKPILIFFSGRATYRVENAEIDGDGASWLSRVAMKSARQWVGKNFRYLDPTNQSIVQLSKNFVATKGGSDQLRMTMTRHGRTVMSNDTSFGSGYYPLTPLEQTVLHVRRLLNSQEFLDENSHLGEDVKVMGVRTGTETAITLAIAFLDRELEEPRVYFSKKRELHQKLLHCLRIFVEKNNFRLRFADDNPSINCLDDEQGALTNPTTPENYCYLTVLGTSAENGDDGAVGRGNRINGLSPYDRPVSQEAFAGKNPISHVGKLYNIMAFLLARRIYESGIAGFDEVYVGLVSRIGQPTNQPQLACLQYVTGQELTALQVKEISRIIQDELDAKLQRNAGEIPLLTQEILRGDYDNGPFLYLLDQKQSRS